MPSFLDDMRGGLTGLKARVSGAMDALGELKELLLAVFVSAISGAPLLTSAEMTGPPTAAGASCQIKMEPKAVAATINDESREKFALINVP